MPDRAHARRPGGPRMFVRALILIAMLWAPAAYAAEFKAGTVVIVQPWTRATPERAKVGGGFMVLTNTGKEDDRLVGATADISGTVEIHEMHVVNGVMMMRHTN